MKWLLQESILEVMKARMRVSHHERGRAGLRRPTCQRECGLGYVVTQSLKLKHKTRMNLSTGPYVCIEHNHNRMRPNG